MSATVEVEGIVLHGVHPEIMCRHRACVVHSPSDHHMRGWSLVWREDRKLFERTCPHGVGHPDPDQFEYWRETHQEFQGVHGCDGCCGSEDRATLDETYRLGSNSLTVDPTPDPLAPVDIVDRIDALVNEQLTGGPEDDYKVNRYDKCGHCDRDWHGFPVTQRVQRMRWEGTYDEDYRIAEDDSPVLCPGSTFIGPRFVPTVAPITPEQQSLLTRLTIESRAGRAGWYHPTFIPEPRVSNDATAYIFRRIQQVLDSVQDGVRRGSMTMGEAMWALRRAAEDAASGPSQEGLRQVTAMQLEAARSRGQVLLLPSEE